MLPGVYLPGQDPTSSVRWNSSETHVNNGQRPSASSSGIPTLFHLINFLVYTSQQKDEQDKYLESTVAFYESSLTGQNPIIGEGHHFTVFAVKFSTSDKRPMRVMKRNPEIYCVKYPNPGLRSEAGFREEIYETVRQELAVLCHPRIEKHDHIIGLLGLEISEDYDDYKIPWPCLLMEYSCFGTLDSFQYDQGKSEHSIFINFLLDVGLALRSLHHCNIIHGDVKSENVLICNHPSRKLTAKLSDFGLAIINPDPEKEYYLLGSTQMWEAPEAHDSLRVEGLKLTDVYSFGLMTWRVFLNHQVPYELLGPDIKQRYRTGTQVEFIRAVKLDESFPEISAHSITCSALPGRIKEIGFEVLHSTLSKEPGERDFEVALQALARDNPAALQRSSEKDDEMGGASAAYWALQKSDDVLTNLLEHLPDKILQLHTRPSVTYALLKELQELMTRDGTIGFLATQLAFHMATTPDLNIGDQSPEYICRLFVRLCQLGSLDHMASLYFYFSMVNNPLPAEFDPNWLQKAADGDYYMAKLSFSKRHPDDYNQWLHQMAEQAASEYASPSQSILSTYLRLGDYKRSRALLGAGITLQSDGDTPSAMHFLVSFDQDSHIMDLAKSIIAAGGLLDEWWGDETVDNLLSAKISGTPLHWACLERNKAMAYVLCKLDTKPDSRNIAKAILVASALHFFDILEILETWINESLLTVADLAQVIASSVWAGLVAAATGRHYHLPRLLRHGPGGIADAALRTFDILLRLQPQDDKNQHSLLTLAVLSGRSELVRYLVLKFGIHQKLEHWRGRIDAAFIHAILSGSYTVFEVFLDIGLISAKQTFDGGKYTALQVCCAARQRNPAFMQKLLDLGCHPDELGPTGQDCLSSFGMAVALGLYDCAILLLQEGADKEFKSGWMGGQTSFWRVLQQPDQPISRMRFLLEALPQEGFGHVNFVAWPGAHSNILHQFATSPWAHYRSSYMVTETMKYIISMIGDKRCLNERSHLGVTALGMAAQHGSFAICQVLLESGTDPNEGLVRTPLNAALEWLNQCIIREEKARGATEPGEQRLAAKLRKEAQDTVDLLVSYGGINRQTPMNLVSAITRGEFKFPAAETLLEIAAGFISPPGPRGNLVNQGTLSLLPASAKAFRAHHGVRTTPQTILSNVARLVSTGTTRQLQPGRKVPNRRYQPHSCWPWLPCSSSKGSWGSTSSDHSVLESLRAPRKTSRSPPRTNSWAHNTSEVSARLPGVFLPGDSQRLSQMSGHRSPTTISKYHRGSQSDTSCSSPSLPASPRLFSNESTIIGSGESTSHMCLPLMPPVPQTQVSKRYPDCEHSIVTESNTISMATPGSVPSSSAVENPRFSHRDLATVNRQLSQALARYRQIYMSTNRDEADSKNPFRGKHLLNLLREVLSQDKISIGSPCESVDHCEGFGIILSTIEASVGDLARYGIAIMPTLVDNTLTISVSDDQHEKD